MGAGEDLPNTADSMLLISDDTDLVRVMRDAFTGRGLRITWDQKSRGD